MPSVLNHVGDTRFPNTSMKCSPAGAPATSIGGVKALLNGVTYEIAASATSGSACTTSRTCSYIGNRCAASIVVCFASTVTTSMRWDSKPSDRVASDANVLMNRPAATTRTTDKATCATTSQPARAPRGCPVDATPRSFSASTGATRDTRNPGAVPETIVVNAVIAMVNA